jgi:hypothetical protein
VADLPLDEEIPLELDNEDALFANEEE